MRLNNRRLERNEEAVERKGMDEKRENVAKTASGKEEERVEERRKFGRFLVGEVKMGIAGRGRGNRGIR